jgi:hypothetical protein
MKIKISWQIFDDYSKIKFLVNPSNGSSVVSCGRTDRQKGGHDETNSRFFVILEVRLKTEKMWNSKSGTSSHILSKSLVADHAGMRSYTACATDSVI